MEDSELYKAIGKNIKKTRGLRGLSQLQFAIKLGEYPNRISEIECGRKNLTLKTLNKIATSLGVEPKDLFNF